MEYHITVDDKLLYMLESAVIFRSMYLDDLLDREHMLEVDCAYYAEAGTTLQAAYREEMEALDKLQVLLRNSKPQPLLPAAGL